MIKKFCFLEKLFSPGAWGGCPGALGGGFFFARPGGRPPGGWVVFFSPGRPPPTPTTRLLNTKYTPLKIHFF